MPELPEVEIVTRGLKKSILNKKITKAKLFRNKLRRNINPSFIKDISNTEIIEIRRRSKYIIIDLSNDKSIIVHLGMTGKFTIENNIDENNLKKHTHILIYLDNNLTLQYNDVRRFGLVLSMDTKDVENHKLIKNIGIEPLTDNFNGEILFNLLQNKKSNIKTALLDQSLVCGIGNIYACEALFYAGIKPTTEANQLTLKKCEKLSIEIKNILNNSIKSGGSTLRDYVHSDGSIGNFQNSFAVYGREGEPCKKCKSLIKKIKQGGRSTFYCDTCQK